MKRILMLVCMAFILTMATATSVRCPSNPPPPPVSNTITAEYINSTDADVLVELLASNDPNITQDELLLTGTLFRDTVLAGGSLRFDLNCADAKAIIVDRAVLLITNGPAVGSTILYQDPDFFCGEIVSFEFTANADDTQLFVNVAFFPQP